MSMKLSLKLFVSAAAALLLSACGGGGGSDGQLSAASTTEGGVEAQGVVRAVSTTTQMVGSAIVPNTTTVTRPANRSEAARFLTQATFGPIDADIDRLMAIGYEAWLKEQLAAPMNGVSHLAFFDQAYATSNNLSTPYTAGGYPTESFWRQALSGSDQLRQRVAFALSEIFVISNSDACGDTVRARGVASYMDMLGKKAFGSYRSLLQSVALNPIMGCFLSHVANQKEDPASGREPDQNFAREVMQLFSIGLYELNKNGTVKLDASGQPLETYSTADVVGLSKVFTGWSWYCGDMTDRCFMLGIPLSGATLDRWTVDMQPFPKFHSVSEKSFLGVTVPAQATSDPATSLKVALDRLSSHPNVAPFIGKQLIQRLVTSNPSEQYVARVSAAFDNSGGNLGAMVYAILMDPEARDMSAAMSSKTFGKPREPVLKLSAFLRAYGATSTSGGYLMFYLDDPAYALAQSPMRSPTVFNFFRPGYVMPGSQSAMSGLLTPELQLLNETSIGGYANHMMSSIERGFGKAGYTGTAGAQDILTAYQRDPNHAIYALSDSPSGLVEDVNRKLMYGQMSTGLKQAIVGAVSKVNHGTSTSEQLQSTRKYRVWTALLLTVVSPEFQIQR